MPKRMNVLKLDLRQCFIDTHLMSYEERGVYFDLLLMYAFGHVVPDSPVQVRELLRKRSVSDDCDIDSVLRCFETAPDPDHPDIEEMRRIYVKSIEPLFKANREFRW